MKRWQKNGNGRGGRWSARLSDLPHGARVRVSDITGDQAERSRLCSLGITPGTEIEISDHLPGSCRLRVRGSALALTGDIAENIICEGE